MKETDRPDSEQQLILENTGLVVSLAKSFKPKNSLEFEEYVQSGRIGLWKAIKKHEPKKGALSTIAWYYIRWEIIRGIVFNSKMQPVRFADLGVDVDSFLDRRKPPDNIQDVQPDTLNAIEKEVLKMRSRGYTMKEIGENFSRSRGWANEKFKSAINKIKEAIND